MQLVNSIKFVHSYTIHYTYIYNSREKMVTNSMFAASAFFGTVSVLHEDRMFEGKTPTAF